MNSSKKGILFTIVGGICWGISGVCGQYLIETRNVDVKWLVSVRLFLAGLIMLFMCFFKKSERQNLLKVWQDERDVLNLILYSIFGMLACQFTYFMAISYSNAATATILQYTAPAIIMVYTAIVAKKMPIKKDIFCMAIVIIGTFLISTHGNINSLAISAKALCWGLISACTVVLYNVMPVRLMNKYSTISIVGLGMIVSGVPMCIINGVWNVSGSFDVFGIIVLGVIVIIGTITSFSFYLEGVRLIGASKASIFAGSEPLTSAIATAIFMKVAFTGVDIVGLIFILVGVTVLSIKRN